MNRRIVHAWWVHVPAVLMIVAYVGVSLWMSGSWPDLVPLQVDLMGQPTSWGSPWVAFALVVGLSLLFLTISTVIDELWARQEAQKRFNPLTLLDEFIIGLLVTIQGGFVYSFGGDAIAGYSWATPAACAIAALLAAGWLEGRRPFSPPAVMVVEPQVAAFARSLDERITRGQRIVYWDVQNPAYVTWLSLGLPAVFWASAGLTYASEPWAAVLLGVLGLLFIQFYGGQRTRVTNDTVTIRYGLAGLRVLRCETKSIVGVSVRSFAALREFGGYGIRVSGSTIGYFLGGSRGVRMRRNGRRDVLIGSRHPERLAEAIRAVASLTEVSREEGEAAS